MITTLIRLLIKRTAYLSAWISIILIYSCSYDNPQENNEITVNKLSTELEAVRDFVPVNTVIAHRGSTYWAPEETEAAFRWARNIGADYLECDLQITSDGVIIALHDVELKRTTNVEDIFPDRAENPASSFTYEELMQLDAGTWFNLARPEQARASFATQKQYISTLEDLIMIAEGKRLKRDSNTQERIYSKVVKDDGFVEYNFEYEPDPMENGHRPGIYVETKEPSVNPNIEQALYEKLDQLGWNILTKPATGSGQFYKGLDGKQKVNVGNTSGKVALQTFSHESLKNLNNIFAGKIPTLFLFWLGDGLDDMPSSDPATYAGFINFGIENKAVFFGPSIAGSPNNYDELLEPWQAELIHSSGAAIHAYSFDTPEQMNKYYFGEAGLPKPNRPLVDGMFTNLADMTLNFYHENGVRPVGAEGTAAEILTNLGY